MDAFQAPDADAKVKRPKLHASLKAVLRPSETKQYVVIVGENGTGKSTAVRQVLSKLEEPKGVVYINCSQYNRFSLQLSRLIGYEAESDIRGGIKRYIERGNREDSLDFSQEPSATFRKLATPLLEAAGQYKAATNRPMVLVIDSTDILAKRDPLFLEELQTYAKDCADRGTLRVVFVSSDRTALHFLMSKSAWSRASVPFEIGEISDEDAVQYLVDCNIPKDIAEKAVHTFTGGLFRILNDFVSRYSQGQTLDEIIDSENWKLSAKLRKLEINKHNEAFRHLLTHGFIVEDVALSFLSVKAVDALVANNILALHPNTKLTFHHRHVAAWFAENSETKRGDQN
jgi:ABC-type oligopeptide transport system ATPase subunit